MKKRRKIIGIGILILVMLLFTFAKVKRITPLSWGHHEVNKAMFSSEAINGYDAVAYFIENKAIQGKEMYVFNWKDADWYFSSDENRKMFSKNPEQYVPQFGGYCSFAISKGFTANTNPEVFEIIDGKLYLFDSEGVKADWKANKDENLKACNANW